jgi:anti-sigma factor RsiW
MTREDADRQISASIREHADYHPAPASLLSEVMSALPAEEVPQRPRWHSWLRQGAVMAGVALLTWAATMGYLRPDDRQRQADELVAAHVRATLGKHLYDVASSDQHTVKPWLSARLPYSPPVTDLSGQGFELLGARLDHVDGQAIAVLVYKRRAHIIDAYVRPARGSAANGTLVKDGFNITGLTTADMDFWLVSDLNRNELNDLARLLAQK